VVSRRPLRAGPASLSVESTPADLRWPDVSKELARQPWDDLIPHVLKTGANADPTLDRLRRFGELLLQWNRKVSNLISKNDEERIVTRHLAESIEPAHWLKATGMKRWVDLGSGGGFPAIPLALAGVGSSWTLVESRRTKTLFLRKAIQELGLTDVSVVLDRAEAIAHLSEHAGTYDGFTSRATLTLGPALAIAAQLVRPGGVAFVWKGGRREAEMARDQTWQFQWDFDGLLGIGTGQTAVARFKRK